MGVILNSDHQMVLGQKKKADPKDNKTKQSKNIESYLAMFASDVGGPVPLNRQTPVGLDGSDHGALMKRVWSNQMKHNKTRERMIEG